MTRLFDAGSEKAIKSERERRAEEARRRAAEFDEAMKQAGLDAADDKLGKLLATAPSTVQAIRYEKFRTPGSKWVIEHARVDKDYIYQLHPLKPIADWQSAIGMMIAAMDAIFPRTLHITYTPPAELYQVKFFTIKVAGVVGLPGWEEACRDRALKSLAAVDAWG